MHGVEINFRHATPNSPQGLIYQAYINHSLTFYHPAVIVNKDELMLSRPDLQIVLIN